MAEGTVLLGEEAQTVEVTDACPQSGDGVGCSGGTYVQQYAGAQSVCLRTTRAPAVADGPFDVAMRRR